MSIINNDVVTYTFMLDNADEAVSLAFYLNEHGICAMEIDKQVDVAIPDRDTFDRIEQLKKTWNYYWNTSDDKGLFGLQSYTKEN